MDKLIYTLPMVLLLGIGSAGAQQNYTRADPQSQAEAVTTAQGMASAQSGQKAELRGRIVGRPGENQYLLSDRSGKVLVEIDNELLENRKLPAGTDVEIKGEVDKRNRDSPKVEAKSVTVLVSAPSWQ